MESSEIVAETRGKPRSAWAVRGARWARETRASAAFEFAMVVWPFLLLVLGALQISLIFFLDQSLQTATYAAGRLAMTGQATSMTQSSYQNAVCANLPPMFNCSNLMIDVQSSQSFSTLNTAPIKLTYNPTTHQVTNSFNFSLGNPNDVVILRVMYDWPVIGGAFGLANQANGTFLMEGTTVFKNEPYPTT